MSDDQYMTLGLAVIFFLRMIGDLLILHWVRKDLPEKMLKASSPKGNDADWGYGWKYER